MQLTDDIAAGIISAGIGTLVDSRMFASDGGNGAANWSYDQSADVPMASTLFSKPTKSCLLFFVGA